MLLNRLFLTKIQMMRYMYVLKNIGIDVTMQIIKKSIKKKIHYTLYKRCFTKVRISQIRLTSFTTVKMISISVMHHCERKYHRKC